MKGKENQPLGKDNFVVVIGREFGSGGREIGRKIADALGVNFYDRKLLSEAAGSLGYSPEIFTARDEKRPSPFRTAFSFAFGAVENLQHPSEMSAERIYQCQSDVIRSICARESCVIVGRTADYVMRGHPGLLSIFIHAPLSYRAERIVSRGEARDMKTASDLAERRDSGRENYYNYFTNRRGWGRAANYHLSFDSSQVKAGEIVDIVRKVLSYRN